MLITHTSQRSQLRDLANETAKCAKDLINLVGQVKADEGIDQYKAKIKILQNFSRQQIFFF